MGHLIEWWRGLLPSLLVHSDSLQQRKIGYPEGLKYRGVEGELVA